jgi:hypothetical protein
MKRKLCLGILFIVVGISACKKEEKKEEDKTPTNPTGFTPPTTNYWKIDGLAASSSADAFSINMKATSAGLSKPFSDPIGGYCNVNITSKSWNFETNTEYDIRSQINEGSYKEFNISTKRSLGSEPEGDSLALNLVVQDNVGADAGYYYYVAKGGKLYISKKNGKLRYTTKGVINLIGVKNPNIQNFDFNTSIDLSWAEE